MAIQLSQSSQSVRLCMPLAKFSYANVYAGSIGPIPWIHLTSRDDLFVLIDPFETVTAAGSTEKRYRFKILQDPNAHEDLDLSLLAYEARRAIDESRKASVPGQQPSVTIIVKVPCVAMRYPLQNGQVRRFQIRFLKEEDFYETLKVFAITKLPFVEAGTVYSQHSNIAAQAPSVVPSRDAGSLVTASGLVKFTSPPIPSFHPTTAVTGATHYVLSQGETDSNFASKAVDQASFNDSTVCSMDFRMTDRTNDTNRTISVPVPSAQAAASTCATASSYVPTVPLAPAAKLSTRPSTAPTVMLDSTKTMLPPKRDLPFPCKADQRALPVTAEATESVHTNGHIRTLAPGLNGAVGEPVQLEPQDGRDVVSRRSKRAAVQMKKSQARSKSKVPAARKRGSASESQDTRIPNDEELLQRETGCSLAITNAKPQVDAQELSAEAGVTRALQQSKQEEYDLSSTTAIDVQNGRATVTVAEHGSTDDVERSPTKHTNLEHHAALEPFPDATMHNYSYSGPNIRPRMELVNIEDPKSISSQSAAKSSHSTDVKDTNQSFAKQPLPQLSNKPNVVTSLSLLLSDPNFAQSALNLPIPEPTSNSTTAVQFMSLTPRDQFAAYESFIIQNLENDEFLNLCRTLESIWQRIFVKI